MAILKACRKFATNDKGLETVEYAILVGMIVAASLTALAAIGFWVASQYTFVQEKVGA